MFQFNDELDERSKQDSLDIAKKMLEDLKGVVPTLLNMRVDLNSQKANQDNYDLILVSEFENMEGLNEYIIHPAHKKVGEFIQKVRKSRACIDFEI
jgi:hypothetical protein